MTEQEMRDLFREMRDEPVPADSLARVRMGVNRRRRRFAVWKIALPVALAAACAIGFVMFRPAVPIPLEPPPMITVTPAPVAPVETPVRMVSHPRRVRPRPQQIKTVPVLIRIETPDPDVVILFVN